MTKLEIISLREDEQHFARIGEVSFLCFLSSAASFIESLPRLLFLAGHGKKEKRSPLQCVRLLAQPSDFDGCLPLLHVLLLILLRLRFQLSLFAGTSKSLR